MGCSKMRLFSQDKMVCFVFFTAANGAGLFLITELRHWPFLPASRPSAFEILVFSKFQKNGGIRMGFNCAAEKAKFDREWAKLRKEYANAGMSEKAFKNI